MEKELRNGLGKELEKDWKNGLGKELEKDWKNGLGKELEKDWKNGLGNGLEKELKNGLENEFAGGNKSTGKVDGKKIFLAAGLLVAGMAFNKFTNIKIGPLVSDLIPNRYFVSFFKELVFALFVTVMILLLKKKSVFRFSAKTLAEGLCTGAILIAIGMLGVLLALVNLPEHQLIQSYEILFFVLECFMIGVAEEGLFRGIVQELCLDAIGADTRKKKMISVVMAAGLFGLVHILNIFAGVTPGAAISQAINAAGIGMFLGAICLRSERTLWPVILLHGFMDFGSFAGKGLLWGVSEVEAVNDLSQTIITGLIFFGSFLFLMRPQKGESKDEMEKDMVLQKSCKVGDIGRIEKAGNVARKEKTGNIGKIVAGIVISVIVLLALILMIPFFMTL